MAKLTKLGEYFERKSINKASVTRKTGIGKNRLTRLSHDHTTKLLAQELYLIALAIEVSPSELLEHVYSNLKLKKNKSRDGAITQ